MRELDWKRRSARVETSPRGAVQENRLTSEQETSVNWAIARLNIPWPDLFRALDDAQTTHVALIEIAPDVEHRLIRLSGEAVDPDSMLDYLAGLQQQPGFAEASLRRQETSTQGALRPVRFSIDLLSANRPGGAR